MSEIEARAALFRQVSDALEAIHCLTRLGGDAATLFEASKQVPGFEETLVVKYLNLDMPPAEFIQRASGAFYLWPIELAKEAFNKPLLAELVHQDLFGDDAQGWEGYRDELRVEVPWFGNGLTLVTPKTD